MHRPIDEGGRRTIAPALLAIIIAATLPALHFLPADMRPTVLRVALVAGLAVVLLALLGRMLATLRTDDPDGFEQALKPAVPPVRLDASLKQLRDEIRYSRSSRRYFEKVLWPRLRTLAQRHGDVADDQPAPTTTGWFKRRGPSLRDLTELVDQLEKRR